MVYHGLGTGMVAMEMLAIRSGFLRASCRWMRLPDVFRGILEAGGAPRPLGGPQVPKLTLGRNFQA